MDDAVTARRILFLLSETDHTEECNRSRSDSQGVFHVHKVFPPYGTDKMWRNIRRARRGRKLHPLRSGNHRKNSLFFRSNFVTLGAGWRSSSILLSGAAALGGSARQRRTTRLLSPRAST